MIMFSNKEKELVTREEKMDFIKLYFPASDYNLFYKGWEFFPEEFVDIFVSGIIGLSSEKSNNSKSC